MEFNKYRPVTIVYLLSFRLQNVRYPRDFPFSFPLDPLHLLPPCLPPPSPSSASHPLPSPPPPSSHHLPNAADAQHVRAVADAIPNKAVTYLPAENARLLMLVILDLLLDVVPSRAGFAAPDCPWADAACFLVPLEDLADADMRDAQAASGTNAL